MVPMTREPQRDELIDELAECRHARARARFLRSHQQLWTTEVVERLYARVVQLVRVDLQRADRLAQASTWVAEKLDDDGCRAESLRARGHVLFIGGSYTEALECYDRAVALFTRVGREVDVARTLNGALQSLLLLGKHEEMLAAAGQVRAIYEQHGMALGLARLDSNEGNLFLRLDRFDEALALFQRAHGQLSVLGQPEDVAAVLSNMALCYINLSDFDRALDTYRDARTYCEAHSMPLLVAQADYNIAYLYYLRGQYMRSLELYRIAQEHSDRVKDAYHSALCDLDRSEIYLELNLSEDAAELAERARLHFGRLRMPYEEAKAVTNLALARSREGDIRRARQLFTQARKLFGRTRNDVQLAFVDFYEALVLYRSGRHPAARRLAERARGLFSRASAPAKAALCDLLLARLHLDAGDLQLAEQTCHAASARQAGAETPMLNYQVHFVLGLVREARGDRDAAFEAFEQACAALEQLRGGLNGDNLKIAFFEDKQTVYESVVSTCLARGANAGQLQAAFSYIERAKSRSLADLVAFRTVTLAPRVGGKAAEAVRGLRQELNSHYRQLELAETTDEKRSPRWIEGLRHRTRALENQLTRSLNEIGRTDQEFSALQSGASFGIEDIRSSLAPDTILLEYYQARGRTYACVLGRDQLDIVPLGPIAQLRDLQRLLQFQYSKFRLGADYAAAFGAHLHAATEAHLRDLYRLLIAPVRHLLNASHLVVVPHDVLHALPFHALLDGQRALIDEFTVSYAPSSSVYRLCWAKPATSSGGALIMGVPDHATPFIVDEVRAVASVLPESKLFIGADANAAALRNHGVESRFVHIATHGLFRSDNPMFSSIHLGDGPLCVYDLYQLQLSAELVTLSGCGTGLSVVVGGDEQIGLVRGLLYAGARAVMLTLWDAYDSSTAEFMSAFYGNLQKGWSKARASQAAMRELRTRHTHPFYWAPFALIGNVEAA
jgi:CHAT domain-containing protein